MKTHEIILHARSLAQAGALGFDDDEAFAAWQAQVDALGESIGDKALARRHAEDGLRELAKRVKEEGQRLVEAAKRLDAEADRVEAGTLALLAANVEAGGAEKIQTPDGGWVKLANRSSQAVEITDEDAIPDELMRLKAEPDKAAIGARLKAGEDVPGAKLVTRHSLGISWSK